MWRQAFPGAVLRPGVGASLLAALAAGFALLTPPTANTAEPRDAIRRLPEISHQSDFSNIGADDSGTRTRQDENYIGTWDIGWYPGDINLPGGARVTPGIRYTLGLSEFRNHLDGGATDARSDSFNFQLQLQRDPLSAGFSWYRSDRYSGREGSHQDPEMQVDDDRSFNLGIRQPGLPGFSVSAVSSSDFSSAELGQTGSDYDKIGYALDFQRDFKPGMMRARMQADSWHSRIHRDGSENSGDRTYVEAAQRLNMGAIGSLGLGYTFEEVSQIGAGSLEPSVVSSSRLSLNLDGSLNISRGPRPSPLNYGLLYSNYTSRTLSGAADSTNNQALRTLYFTLVPPTPEGKSAQFRYDTGYSEDEYADRKTSTLTQKLRWDFSPNKLTNAWASYDQTRETDELGQLSNRQIDTVQANLFYRLPGKVPGARGSLNGYYMVGSERYPSTDRSIDRSGLSFSNTLNLSPKAYVNFGYSRNYNDTSSLLFRTDSNDQTRATVNYHINPSDRITLDANWSQQINRYLVSSNKRDAQNLGVTFTYAAPQNWTYTLRLQSNDDHEDQNGLSTYRNGETLQAIVNYTF